MKIYNTYSQQKEDFIPIRDHKIGFYVCGPTVYDNPHVGHGRSAVAFDIVRRYLIYKGFEVTFVSNYTDVDDKMIENADKKNLSVKELADKIIPIYETQYGRLKVMPADIHPKATENVSEMIEIIKQLEKNGHTYKISDGIYFDVATFKKYGELSKQKIDELQSNVRKEMNAEKRNHQDFVLWKFEKPGEPTWNSPWGKGRPGWHIECSAMSAKFLGQPFDIHAGGADLTFPHHECEIAQSECAKGIEYVKYWIHNGFITVNKEKMSKSLGNFFTLEDIINKYSADALRFMFIQSHYRSQIEFSDDILIKAKSAVMRIQDFYRRIENFSGKELSTIDVKVEEVCADALNAFELAMNDDFDTPVAVAVYYDFIRSINNIFDKEGFSMNAKQNVMRIIDRINKVFAILKPTGILPLSQDLQKLINEREIAREQKDWKRADEIRDELLEHGVVLEDTSDGTKWKRINS
ncbi:cysteine--tRNA ligase [Candidatus Peregrinibacteria bacterium]|nr:cysteine--tRNA ligase [Candidatus Peregrinibacteria bacterium]